MLFDMNVSDRIDFLSGQKAIILGQKLFVIAHDLRLQNVIFVELLVIFYRFSVKLVKFLSLIVNGRTDEKGIWIFLISLKVTKIKQIGSVCIKTLGFFCFPCIKVSISFGHGTVNSGIFVGSNR